MVCVRSLCSSKDSWDRFEECFETFWRESAPRAPSSRAKAPRKDLTSPVDKRTPMSLMSTGSGDDVSSGEGWGSGDYRRSARDRLTRRICRLFSHSDLARLEQISLRLFEQMSRRLAREDASQPARRWTCRTIHRNISRGGDPMNLRYRERKPRPHRLVTLRRHQRLDEPL
jgi:uncharacterized protein with von Willebrand factor type A (vWA) domain